MANQQLGDYIKQQLGGGVTVEVVKQALVQAGWPAADVDEAIATASTARPAEQPKVAPVGPGPTTTASPAGPAVKAPAGTPSTRDVVLTGSGGAFGDGNEPVFKATPKVAPAGVAIKTTTTAAGPGQAASWSRFILPGVLVFIIIVLAAFLYLQFSSSSGLTAQMNQLTAERDTLKIQVAGLTKKQADTDTQLQSLTSDNQELSNELSIFTNPRLLSVTSTEQVPVDIMGTLTGSTTTQYFITTKRGIVLYVKNYKDPGVAGALAPLAGTAVKLTGTHLIQSQDITVTRVNDQPIVVPSTTSSTTATPPATPAATSTKQTPPVTPPPATSTKP